MARDKSCVALILKLLGSFATKVRCGMGSVISFLIFLFIHPSILRTDCLSVYLLIYPSIYVFKYLSIHPSIVCLSVSLKITFFVQPQLTPLRLRLLYKLWRIEPRCFQFLHKVHLLPTSSVADPFYFDTAPDPNPRISFVKKNGSGST